MATPRERFVAALKVLKELQDKGTVAIYTGDISNRNYREILLKNGYLKEVLKGWYISSNPGDTTKTSINSDQNPVNH